MTISISFRNIGNTLLGAYLSNFLGVSDNDYFRRRCYYIKPSIQRLADNSDNLTKPYISVLSLQVGQSSL